ncbi:MAG: hypothetical protein U5R31_02090 [Acidimicrobiia bacterium]|nr:hypothetical protein [Acidimicrobiia bacterium]
MGRVKLKVGGGLAGHNGLPLDRGPPPQPRLRAHPDRRRQAPLRAGGAPTTSCGAPRPANEKLDRAVGEAADAVEVLVRDGVDAAMNELHRGPRS